VIAFICNPRNGGGIDRRIMVRSQPRPKKKKNLPDYLKNNLKQKRLEMWFKSFPHLMYFVFIYENRRMKLVHCSKKG
jgi:hypothetical protein